MIVANELRINNWVKYHDGTNIRVTPEIISAQIHANKIKGHGSWIYSIRLTPEILEKCGFTTTTQNNDGSFNMWGRLIDASIDIEEGEVYKYRIYEKLRTKNILSVHQLQNLYFALTGEELQINF